MPSKKGKRKVTFLKEVLLLRNNKIIKGSEGRKVENKKKVEESLGIIFVRLNCRYLLISKHQINAFLGKRSKDHNCHTGCPNKFGIG